jgi:archaellum component FlaC
MTTSEERITELENEVKRLNIKLESLVNHLAVVKSQGFAAPDGRTAYDLKVEKALAQASLSK